VDASAVLIKDTLLRDDPPDHSATSRTPPPQRLKRIFTDDRPECMKCLEEIRQVVDEFPDRVLLGEVQGKTDRIGHFYGEDQPRLHLPLNFALLDSPWDASSLEANIDAYFNAIPQEAWPDWVIGGHDKRRVASKIGQSQGRILAMLLLTLRGTPILFQGDEIGMEEVHIPPERVTDPFEELVGGYGLNRDRQRAPMRWDASRNAGFTTGEPWLPMGDHLAEHNIAQSNVDKRSLLSLYRRLIEVRKKEPALLVGDHIPIRSLNQILTFGRSWKGETIVVALNTIHEPRKLMWSGEGTVLLSTYLDQEGYVVKTPIVLRPDEGIIVKVM
jgi:alpha-glucosidase